MKKIHNYKKLSSLSFLLLGVTIFCCLISCKKENLEELSFVEIETGEVFKESATEVVLSGNLKGIIDDGQVEILAYGHVYSLIDTEPEIDNIGSDTTSVSISLNEPVKNGVFISTFAPPDTSAEFYYRAYVRVKKLVPEKDTILYAENRTLGNEFFSFHVPSFNININPDVVIDGADVITSGSIKENSRNQAFLRYGHIWSDNEDSLKIKDDLSIPINADTTLFTGGGVEFNISSRIVNLDLCPNSNTSYFIRSYAIPINNSIPVYSDPISIQFEDIDAGFWEDRTTPDSLKRYGGISFKLDGVAYVGFGENDTELLNDLWKYNPDRDEWMEVSIMGDLPPARKHANSFVLTDSGNERAFIGFGTDGSSVHNDIWEFTSADEFTGTWSPINPMMNNVPPPLRHSAFSFVIGNNNDIYVGGGVSSYDFPPNNCEILSDLWKINISSDMFYSDNVFPGSNYDLINAQVLASPSDCDDEDDYRLRLECVPICGVNNDCTAMNKPCDMSSGPQCSITDAIVEKCELCGSGIDIGNIPDTCSGITSDERYFRSIGLPELMSNQPYLNDDLKTSYLLKRYGSIAFSNNGRGYVLFGKTISIPDSVVFDIQNYYLEIDPQGGKIKLYEFPDPERINLERSYPFSFVMKNELMQNEFYFGGGIDNSSIVGPDPKPINIDFFKFDPDSGVLESLPDCGFDGLGMGLGFSVKTQFSDEERAYAGLGKERSGVSNRVFTYIQECE